MKIDLNLYIELLQKEIRRLRLRQGGTRAEMLGITTHELMPEDLAPDTFSPERNIEY